MNKLAVAARMSEGSVEDNFTTALLSNAAGGLFTSTNIVGRQCWQTSSVCICGLFANSPQTNSWRFLFPFGN
jgi:hypothetical protein